MIILFIADVKILMDIKWSYHVLPNYVDYWAQNSQRILSVESSLF